MKFYAALGSLAIIGGIVTQLLGVAVGAGHWALALGTAWVMFGILLACLAEIGGRIK